MEETEVLPKIKHLYVKKRIMSERKLKTTHSTDKELVDRQFYEDVNLYLDQNMIEDTNLDLFYMDYLGMNELVDLQWQR